MLEQFSSALAPPAFRTRPSTRRALYPAELRGHLVSVFDRHLVDPDWVRFDAVERRLATGSPDDVLDFLADRGYRFVDDTASEMSGLAVFRGHGR